MIIKKKTKLEIMNLMKELDKKFKININLKNPESYGDVYKIFIELN